MQEPCAAFRGRSELRQKWLLPRLTQQLQKYLGQPKREGRGLGNGYPRRVRKTPHLVRAPAGTRPRGEPLPPPGSSWLPPGPGQTLPAEPGNAFY